jgi:hypothetical protein
MCQRPTSDSILERTQYLIEKNEMNPKQTDSCTAETVSTTTSSRRAIRMKPKKKRSSHSIRNNYLSKLGFKQNSPPPSQYSPPERSNSDRNSRHNQKVHHCQLNGGSDRRNDSEEQERQQTSDSPKSVGKINEILTERKKQRSVSFDNNVQVLPIPSKDSYSDRIRKYLWSNPSEMLHNASRNAREFRFENWDWRQVADDAEFFRCPVTGDLIHPCHVSSMQHTRVHRSLNDNPFLQKSRQAALEWQQYRV